MYPAPRINIWWCFYKVDLHFTAISYPKWNSLLRFLLQVHSKWGMPDRDHQVVRIFIQHRRIFIICCYVLQFWFLVNQCVIYRLNFSHFSFLLEYMAHTTCLQWTWCLASFLIFCHLFPFHFISSIIFMCHICYGMHMANISISLSSCVPF